MFHTDHFSFSQSNPVSVLAAQSVDPPVQPTQKRRGRPPSNPTSIPTSAAEPKRRGRPPGSKNKPKDDPTRGTGRGRGGRGRGKGRGSHPRELRNQCRAEAQDVIIWLYLIPTSTKLCGMTTWSLRVSTMSSDKRMTMRNSSLFDDVLFICLCFDILKLTFESLER